MTRITLLFVAADGGVYCFDCSHDATITAIEPNIEDPDLFDDPPVRCADCGHRIPQALPIFPVR